MNNNNNKVIKNKIRVFQIGFNKCGTRSLFKFFKKNGIESIHYDKGNIAISMFNNFNQNKKLIDKKYAGVVFFFRYGMYS